MVTEVTHQPTRPARFNAGIDRAIALLRLQRIDLYNAEQSPVALELEAAIQELKNTKIQ